MVIVLVAVAIIAGLVGLLFASQATAGAAIVGFACLLAILARVAQADRQHRQAHPEVFRNNLQERPLAPPMTAEEIAANRRTTRLILAALGAVVVVSMIGIVYFRETMAGASVPSSTSSISFTVAETADAWRITNESDYLLNVCWAEHQGRRAVIPTMVGRTTVTVSRSAFRDVDNATAGDLTITCNADGSDVVGTIRRE